jgi:hypothetical protein
MMGSVPRADGVGDVGGGVDECGVHPDGRTPYKERFRQENCLPDNTKIYIFFIVLETSTSKQVL